MPVSQGIFYELQRGGLCRLHSINGFFGEAKVSTEQFNEFSKKMDKYIGDKFHEESHCLKFDSVSSDHNILVSFILKHYGVYSRYLHMNSLFQNPKQLQNNLNDLNGNYFFVFNAGHIWGIRRFNNKWYKVDSLSGVQTFQVNTLTNLRDVSFLFPVIPKDEFYRNLKTIQSILKRDITDIEINTLDKIKTYLGEINEKQLILGDLEVPLGVTMDILDVVFELKTFCSGKPGCYLEKEQFKPIEKIIRQYDAFLFQFTPSKYHNKDLKVDYLSDVLLVLINLGKQK
jgi:hypothetical protein